MGDQLSTNRPTTAPTAQNVSVAAGLTGGVQDFQRYIRDNHQGHEVQHVGFARVAPGTMGVLARYGAKQGILDIWFCGTEGTILYDLA
jgi:hypothetical protein